MVLAILVTLALGLLPVHDVGAHVGPVDAQAGADGVRLDTPLADVEASADGASASSPLVPAGSPLLPGLLGSESARYAAQDGTAARDPSSGSGIDLVPESAPARAAAGASVLAGLTALGWAILRAAGLTPLLPFFSRIEDGELATHPARRQALDYIAANPGATVQDIRGALGLAWGTTVHHLRRLERAGLIAVRRDGGRRGHWPLGQAPPRDGLSAADRALAVLVRTHPGLAQKEIARVAGVGAPAACKRLARLEEAGLVTQVRDGRSRLYVPTARLLAADLPEPPAVAHVVPATASPESQLVAPLA